ncbi:MAG TPA: NAD(P)H-binding protein [Parafilimonas sp.]|nr:NAD(P)H-binding protein [Parafilimonas sp.]
MKIVLTGSLGHISKPLATLLIAKGHAVTVISSNSGKQADIEALGATAAIGSIDDVAFLTGTFTGADIVYTMIPPVNFFDANIDVTKAYQKIAQNYFQAIQQSWVKKIIHLSTIGAHTNTGNGMLRYGYDVENILRELPNTVSIKIMRPVGFYYNMFAFIPSIKNANAIIQNYGGDEKEPWVSPLDIAAVIDEEIEKPFNGRTIRYIASDEVSPNEVAKILGEAIGKKDLKWLVISDEEFIDNLVRAGFSKQAAEGFAGMNAGRVSGVLYEDYFRNKPTLGKIKLTDFAHEFAKVYNSNSNIDH